MTDRFEEDLGKFTYVTLPQVKDYLSISSNTQDARLANIVSYAVGVIEHYIGQEILANTYVETFDGGTNSLFVSRIPLNDVYQITEFNGAEHEILADPTVTGAPNPTTGSDLSLTFVNGASINNKIKRFGQSSLAVPFGGYITSAVVPDNLLLGESDFTIEAFLRVDNSALSNSSIVELGTDTSNYMSFTTSPDYGLAFTANIAGVATTIKGANALIESQQFAKRKWAHVSVSRDLENERLYLHYNGTQIANASYDVFDHTFTSYVNIGKDFSGYIDELRISSAARYRNSFTAPTHRFRPDAATLCLIHFDGAAGSTVAVDAHAEPNDYTFDRGTGKITRDAGSRSTKKSYSSLSLSGPTVFQPYPNGVRVEYRAGYELGSIPYDLQLATLDFIKIIYKQDQEKKGFSFEGEKGESFNLSSNFPPHVARVLDLYRIIK